MLWGGSGLLAFEHLWHGEIVPWFPFLTNASNPTDASIMLQEMATVGVTMSLLVTAVWGTLMFAAVISTVIWYMSKNARRLKIGVLCCSFWGTSVMWFVDAVFEYAEMGAEYFSPPALDMLNDIFLGLSVTALALIVWLATLFIKDPYRVLKYEILNKQ